MRPNKAPKPIMVVEDSPEDFEVLKRALRKAELEYPLHRCKNGQDALDFLYKTGGYEDYENAPSPSLIMLDLNMPGTDGHSVLEKVKTDEELKSIPVIVLSTSTNIDDIHNSYQSGANSYVPKPPDMQGYVDMAKTIKDYWFSCSILPLEEANP